MVQAIWRICIIRAPSYPNYRESSAYQAVELRYDPVLAPHSFIPAAKGELPFLPLPEFPPSHSIWNGVGILLYIRRDWGIFHREGDETSGVVGSSLPIKLRAVPEAED